MEHELKDDHSDVITCMDACPKLRIFATSSMDGDVRIWNNENCLIRYFHIDSSCIKTCCILVANYTKISTLGILTFKI